MKNILLREEDNSFAIRKMPILLNECSLVESLQKALERVQYSEIEGNEFHRKTILVIAKIFRECI